MYDALKIATIYKCLYAYTYTYISEALCKKDL